VGGFLFILLCPSVFARVTTTSAECVMAILTYSTILVVFIALSIQPDDDDILHSIRMSTDLVYQRTSAIADMMLLHSQILGPIRDNTFEIYARVDQIAQRMAVAAANATATAMVTVPAAAAAVPATSNAFGL
jgi:hypothetical protein